MKEKPNGSQESWFAISQFLNFFELLWTSQLELGERKRWKVKMVKSLPVTWNLSSWTLFELFRTPKSNIELRASKQLTRKSFKRVTQKTFECKVPYDSVYNQWYTWLLTMYMTLYERNSLSIHKMEGFQQIPYGSL